MSKNKPIILASGSAARKVMLANAGLEFTVIPADVEEYALMKDMGAKGLSCLDMALALACAKGKNVSNAHAGALVIGADQILECDGQMMTKAKDASDACDKLKALRGKTHKLISAVCVAVDGDIIWKGADEALLTMHDFDDEFLDRYINKAGDALTQSVGAYQLENEGSWLFDKIEGDYFTILGMPLLPLLGFLRTAQGMDL